MNNDLRCLLGSINEFFMPPDLFMEIAERLFGHNQKIINELKKIKDVYKRQIIIVKR